MKLFRKDSAGDEEQDPTIPELRRRFAAAQLPADVVTLVERELDMLFRINSAAAEYTIGLTYLEYLAALPWHRTTEDNLDLARAERILDEHHYGLGQVKERILEHLAIKALRRRRQPRVLAVDDDQTARRNLALALARENCEVVTVASAREAFEQLEAREFDLLLTDLHLGQSDGMELLERTRARWPDTRVVVITGYASIPSAVEAVKKGAFQYLAKPYAIEELRSIVRRALDGRALLKGTKGSVLCFAGPPGTGKTSVGRAIAQALGRTFSRISLGGIRDEADIRGHRRTYAGAKPGRVIEEIRRVESANPVLMLDELDKIGREVKGDPASALLEVLDPEQNHAFLDHYLDVPFDLSGVLFIVTVNLTDPVPEALLDRLEVIEFPGYTEEEKAKIAARFLCPKQLREKGLGIDQVTFAPEAIGLIIREYTREAGIRGLERRIATVCRKIARASLGAAPQAALTVTPELVAGWIGRRLQRREVMGGEDRVGVATGLVRTESGGEIIFVEAARMPGTKELIITGSLGEVMRESVQAALSYLRSKAGVYGIPADFFERHDLHVHIPRGAVPKDGPSAGVTVLAALASLLTGRPARRDVASTGEITLTGRILPVGGVREKVLAARRAGLAAVVVPDANLAEIEELDEETRRGIEIHTAAAVPEALELILREHAGRRGGAEGRSPAGERSEADGGPQRQDPEART
ncbi:MAG: S16 family serine protease, partial [Candidatus Geothermincolia bacterium]